MKKISYKEKDAKVRGELLKWTKFQVIITFYLTISVVVYAMMNFANLYPNLVSGVTTLIILGAISVVIYYALSKDMKE